MIHATTIEKARNIREIIRLNDDFSTLDRLIKDLSKIHFTMTLSGWTLLHEAVKFNNDEAIRILHKHGHPLVVYNESGFNALHCAATLNHIESVNTLISLGHPVDTFDHYRKTPLHLAVSCLNVESVSCLISHFANKTCKNSFQQTPKDLLVEMIRNGTYSPKIETLMKLLS
jgi:ankyrin repeat protein